MKNHLLILGLALTAVAAGSARTYGETLEEVEKKLADTISKHKSVAFKMKTTTDLKTPQMKYKSDSDGLMEMVRRGEDKWVSRMEAKTSSEHKVGDEKEQKDESKILLIYDGEFSYSYSETGEQKSAMKTKPDSKMNWNPFNGKEMFKEYHKNYDFKMLPDETINGKSVYVIEMTAKKTEENKEQIGVQRTVNYYGKDTGFTIKTVGYDKDGKVALTSTVTDIKLDEEIKPERFVFKAPAGVEVTDMTKMQDPPPEEKKETAEKPAPEPENKEEKKADDKPKEEPKPKKKGVGGLLNKLK